MSLFVVGCFTPEFQDIFDGDLDGYLLIGNDGDIDGSYLPRNYDNDIPDQNCDLPIRRSKRAEAYNVLSGTFFEVQFEVDNSSNFGGGPLDASGTRVVLEYPEGLIPYSASNPSTVTGNKVTCNLGLVRRFEKKGVAIRFYAAKTGNFTLDGEVSSDLVDPDPSNNQVSATIDVVEPQTRLVYPWLSNNEQFSTVIVINNFGPDEAMVWLSAAREEGAFFARHLIIPPRGFLKGATEDLFPDIGEGGGYAMRLISESPDIRGRWVSQNLASASGNSPAQGVAIRVPEPQVTKNQRSGNEILFGYLPVSTTQISAPVLVNMGDDSADVTLDFYNEAGELVLSDMQTLAGLAQNRPFARVANQLVDQEAGDVYLIATSPNQAITGVGFVFNTNREPAIGNVTQIDTRAPNVGGTRMILPWISNNEQFESIVVVNNYGTDSTTVTLTARRKEGDPETVNRNIPAGGFLKESASSLFPLLGDGSGYAVLVESDDAPITGNWVSDNLTTASQGSPSQGVGIRIEDGDSPRFGKNILFGYLPLTDQIISAPVVVNVGDQPAQVTMHFYNEAGEAIAVDDTTLANLPPMRPFAAVANDLVPEGSGDVYMVATSNGQPITGVAFVFNSGAEPAIGNVSQILWNPDP